MQKLVKRAAQAQRQAVQKGQKRAGTEGREANRRNTSAIKTAVSEVRNNLKDARRARRENWELGPLAPKRNLGNNKYGVVTENFRVDWSNGSDYLPRPQLVERRCAWAGGPKQLNLAKGDRVVILEGLDRGRIDRIKEVQADTGSVLLESRSRAHFDNIVTATTIAQSVPVSIGALRLVYPMRNPETGVTRDVIINQLKAVPPNMQSSNMTLDRWQYGKKWDRVAPAINTVIPWPAVEVPEYEVNDADTAREQVGERTFHYNLLAPPMPEQILDELRNKFSRFRTRHESWYVEKKEAQEAARRGSTKLHPSMQTPLDEFHEKQRELRAAQGEPELTDEMLEKLGALMAQKKAAALNDAGAEEVQSTKLE